MTLDATVRERTHRSAHEDDDDDDEYERAALERVRECMEACGASVDDSNRHLGGAILSEPARTLDEHDAREENGEIEELALATIMRDDGAHDEVRVVESKVYVDDEENGEANGHGDSPALAQALEDERTKRQSLEGELDAKDAVHANALEALAQKMRDAEAGRAEAEAEVSHLRSELARMETVIRQEEGVIRLRLEAEHEVRVGRLATELDRVRGELEARSRDLEETFERNEKTFEELERVREHLLGRLKTETQGILGTVDRVFDVFGSISKSLHRIDAETPRVSQIVPSKRDRTLVIDVAKHASRGHALATSDPSTPTNSRSSRRSGNVNAFIPPGRRDTSSGATASQQQSASRRFQLSAHPDRRAKPVTSNKGLVGYANAH
ncbi:unnamed product [Ostreococcus tauri]|uniref:Myosin heavy chain-fluke n=1 Tax=Ostreococcus tauri TaxID=70448 RepID=Q014C6_OSTTA|nr:unnamed product [Ostreococcus tauri]OUS46771.1 myosin heavy chain-fluke [Ostreococcus tauri]CAL54753.1 unnamed product [Ostreococcus tauri]|eukprot:XP_003080585.1 unnamed product [Ostreococcus tauri]